MPGDLHAVIRGRAFAGWTSIRVSASVDDLAVSFDLAAPRAPGRLDVAPGDPVTITIDDQPVIVGHCNAVRRSGRATSREIQIAGRSLAGDLCDSSVIERHTWRETDPLAVARGIVDPIAVPVRSAVAGLPLVRFRTEVGEERATALDRLAKPLAARWRSLADGSIELARVDPARAPIGSIVRGHNVVAFDVEERDDERFSDYVFRAQLATDDELSGDAAANVDAAVSDPGVARYRPLVLTDDTQGGRVALRLRAAWERNTRAARATRLRYEIVDPVDGRRSWYAGGSRLWWPWEIVTVSDPEEGIAGRWLVARVELTRAADRWATSVDLVAPGAYDPEPTPPARRGVESW